MDEGSLGTVVPTLQDGSNLKPHAGDSPRLHHSHHDTLGSVRSSIASRNSYRAAFTATPFGLPQQSPLNTPRHIMRNPIYDASQGAYP